MRRLKAKYNGHCETCQGPINVGSTIMWSRREGSHHSECWEGMTSDDPVRRAEEREYQEGYAAAKRYSQERQFYGDEMADQFEIERELAAFNRGDDW